MQSQNNEATEVARGHGGHMHISEKRQCYVPGQCQVILAKYGSYFFLLLSVSITYQQEYSVDFQGCPVGEGDAKSCHKFCGKTEGCKWWLFLSTWASLK